MQIPPCGSLSSGSTTLFLLFFDEDAVVLPRFCRESITVKSGEIRPVRVKKKHMSINSQLFYAGCSHSSTALVLWSLGFYLDIWNVVVECLGILLGTVTLPSGHSSYLDHRSHRKMCSLAIASLLTYVTKDRQGDTTFTYQINHELCGSCTQYCLASIWWGQRGITMEAFVGRPDVRRSSTGNR